MKISIITASYNSAETIEDTIQSVLSQDYSNLEYIIIDGGSTDATRDIINKYDQKIFRVISELDEGIYDAMNKGIRLASGEVIGILNSDDTFNGPHIISEVMAIFSLELVESVYGDLLYVDRKDDSVIKRYWKSGAMNNKSFKFGWMPPHPAFFVLKSCYTKLGLYSTELRTSADYELMLRFLFKEKIKTTYLPKVITRMKIGGQSNSSISNRFLANREDKVAWKINGLRPSWYTFILKPLRKAQQFYRRPNEAEIRD